jgi:hypothetical protein
MRLQGGAGRRDGYLRGCLVCLGVGGRCSAVCDHAGAGGRARAGEPSIHIHDMHNYTRDGRGDEVRRTGQRCGGLGAVLEGGDLGWGGVGWRAWLCAAGLNRAGACAGEGCGSLLQNGGALDQVGSKEARWTRLDARRRVGPGWTQGGALDQVGLSPRLPDMRPSCVCLRVCVSVRLSVSACLPACLPCLPACRSVSDGLSVALAGGQAYAVRSDFDRPAGSAGGGKPTSAFGTSERFTSPGAAPCPAPCPPLAPRPCRRLCRRRRRRVRRRQRRELFAGG